MTFKKALNAYKVPLYGLIWSILAPKPTIIEGISQKLSVLTAATPGRSAESQATKNQAVG